jgi:phosphatidylglycerophosphate synthase
MQCNTGLPDDIFSDQKSKFGQILEALAMKDVGVHILWTCRLFYSHCVYLKTFGICCVFLVYFSRFGMLYQEKSGNPGAIMRF